jgi:hypothetical protein
MLHDECLKVVQEGLIRNALMYGPITNIKMWFTKVFAGDNIVNGFESVMTSLKIIVDELDSLGTKFSNKYTNKKELESLFNDSIYFCVYKKEYDNRKFGDEGTCVVKYFLNVVVNINRQIFQETIILLREDGVDITQIKTIDDFSRIKLKEESNLKDLISYINNYIATLIEFLSSKHFNKYFTFSAIRKAIINTEYRIEMINELNKNINRDTTMFNNSGNRILSTTL